MSQLKYKVAHILPWTGIAGTEHATLRIAQAVKNHGFESIVFCSSDGTAVANFFHQAGFETTVWDPEHTGFKNLKGYLYRTSQLHKELKRLKIDFVHCVDFHPALWSTFAVKLARLPVICHVRNRYEEIARSDFKYLRGVNKFVFVSQDTWNRFGYPVTKERGTVIYDGVDIDQHIESKVSKNKSAVCNEFDIPDNVKLIGMVARVAPQKDYNTLIKAAKKIVMLQPDAHFLIVGGYSDNSSHYEHFLEIKGRLREENLESYFTFTDFRTDVDRLMDAIDIFVLSTHWEGLPLVIIEAMAKSKPVIATSVDGIPEIVIHNQTGLLFPHQDSEALAAHTIKLLQDSKLAEQLGSAGRHQVLAKFSKQQFEASVVNLYTNMVKNVHMKTTPSVKSKKWTANADM